MTLAISPERRAFLAQIGSLGGMTAALSVDTDARARAGQSKFRENFADGHSCTVCPPIAITAVDPVKRAQDADRLYRMHFKRLAMRRAR